MCEEGSECGCVPGVLQSDVLLPCVMLHSNKEVRHDLASDELLTCHVCTYIHDVSAAQESLAFNPSHHNLDHV